MDGMDGSGGMDETFNEFSFGVFDIDAPWPQPMFGGEFRASSNNPSNIDTQTLTSTAAANSVVPHAVNNPAGDSNDSTETATQVQQVTTAPLTGPGAGDFVSDAVNNPVDEDFERFWDNFQAPEDPHLEDTLDFLDFGNGAALGTIASPSGSQETPAQAQYPVFPAAYPGFPALQPVQQYGGWPLAGGMATQQPWPGVQQPAMTMPPPPAIHQGLALRPGPAALPGTVPVPANMNSVTDNSAGRAPRAPQQRRAEHAPPDEYTPAQLADAMARVDDLVRRGAAGNLQVGRQHPRRTSPTWDPEIEAKAWTMIKREVRHQAALYLLANPLDDTKARQVLLGRARRNRLQIPQREKAKADKAAGRRT